MALKLKIPHIAADDFYASAYLRDMRRLFLSVEKRPASSINLLLTTDAEPAADECLSRQQRAASKGSKRALHSGGHLASWEI